MMRHFFILLFAVLVAMIAATGVMAQDQPDFPAPQNHLVDAVCAGLDGANLLQNPSFEGEYSAYIPPGGHDDCPTGTCGTAQMADGWTPYWRSHNPSDPAEIIRMPEYKPADAGQDPPRTHDGDRAQQYFTPFSTHEAGFYQQVSVVPGNFYCFGIWGHSWSSSDDYPFTSDSEIEQNIGIDPTGGTDWQSQDIVWGGPKQYYHEIGEDNAFGPFTLVVEAQSSQITVFTWSKPVWPVKHNDVYWDQAILLEAPEEPVMSLSRHGIAIVREPGSALYNLLVDISFVQDPGLTWSATADTGNTLDVTLWPPVGPVGGNAAGTGDDDLSIRFSTESYSPGSYNATVTVESHPPVTGSPATVNVSLHIFEEIHNIYLPHFGR